MVLFGILGILPALTTLIPNTPRAATDEFRVRTRELHARAESELKIMERIRARDSYAFLIEQMGGFFEAMEQQLGKLDWSLAGLNFEERRKAHLLRMDLAGMGKSSWAPYRGALPFADLAGGMGALYVLEGSTIGGQFIVQELVQQGAWARENARFYAAYGERTGFMWNEFKTRANLFCDSPARIDEATRAAVATFEQFVEWVSPSKA